MKRMGRVGQVVGVLALGGVGWLGGSVVGCGSANADEPEVSTVACETDTFKTGDIAHSVYAVKTFEGLSAAEIASRVTILWSPPTNEPLAGYKFVREPHNERAGLLVADGKAAFPCGGWVEGKPKPDLPAVTFVLRP
jgi:hypothetical protein